FKTFNDRFGHHTGDKVLTMVAKTIISTLRPTDIASRWGGDEFVIFIPDVEIQELKKLAERLRKLIELSWIDLNGEHISVTASIGGAEVRTNETISSAIKRADEQVYLSKHSGRNFIHIDK
ncbi:GGDEF domain-containing protein, partial [Aduncisulcus paluster]